MEGDREENRFSGLLADCLFKLVLEMLSTTVRYVLHMTLCSIYVDRSWLAIAIRLSSPPN